MFLEVPQAAFIIARLLLKLIHKPILREKGYLVSSHVRSITFDQLSLSGAEYHVSGVYAPQFISYSDISQLVETLRRYVDRYFSEANMTNEINHNKSL